MVEERRSVKFIRSKGFEGDIPNIVLQNKKLKETYADWLEEFAQLETERENNLTMIKVLKGLVKQRELEKTGIPKKGLFGEKLMKEHEAKITILKIEIADLEKKIL